MSLTGHHMPPRTTQQSHRPRVSDRTMVGTLPPRCLQALPHGTKNAATDGPGYRATPRSTTEPHRGWMSDTYLLHLHAEGEKCFLLTSPFIEPAGKRERWASSPGRQTKRQPLSARPERDVSYSCILSFARTSMRYRFPNKSSTSMRTDISDGLCLTDANARTRTSVPEYGATVTGVSFRFMKVSSSDDSL